jgi:serine protease inhibitor
MTQFSFPAMQRRSTGPLRAAFLGCLVLGLPACDLGTGSGGGGADGPPTPITELPRPLTVSEEAAVEASNAFGLELLGQMAIRAPGKTVFLSPLSASMALGMAMNGADGSTFAGIRSTLGFGGASEADMNAAYRGLLDLLPALDPGVNVRVANALWHRSGVSFLEDYRTRVTSTFDARVEGLDFGDPTSATRINDWVRDATVGRIRTMVTPPIPANTVALLLNAVYFEAGWRLPFDPADTREEAFHLAGGGTAPIQLMLRDDTMSVHVTGDWAAVDLPYAAGAYSMTVVVPTGANSVEGLLTRLDADGWENLVTGFQTMRAQVHLPRFELAWEGVLNESLADMGMHEAFASGQADFSRMFPGGGVWIDEVKQKSFLRVDEEGTVAAASTSVAMTDSMPPEVRADRPFLLAIRERLTGTILFVGVIREAPEVPASTPAAGQSGA